MRYENISTNTISVKINKEYEIIAMIMWHKDTADYDVSYYLTKPEIKMLDFMYAENNVFPTSDVRTIKHDVVKYIECLYKKGDFQRYINRYEYMLKCFDVGNTIEEYKQLH